MTLSIQTSSGVVPGIEIRPAKIADAEKLAPVLREPDRREIQAATGRSSLAVLRGGIAVSDPSYAIVSGLRQVAAIFGAVPDEHCADSGRIWLLGSDILSRHRFTLVRLSGPWMQQLHQRYRVLWNYVDTRNELHIRWIRLCGFQFLRRVEHYGFESRPFYHFQSIRGACSNL